MLSLTNISKSYGRFSLQDIDLEIARGEYFVLLGRSGSGKSQLLEVISGLRKADNGSIFLDGTDITDSKIQVRPIGMVFQDFALFPHLSVYENIAYPLRMSRMDKSDIESKVESIANEVNISHLLSRKPGLLSGGEKQRVAVARTLVRSPKIILLDEPMSAIDTTLRDDLRRLLRKINNAGMTILHVTHDYREAVRLADRVGVIHNGRIIQSGTPDEVFDKPVNRFVARFAGIQNFFKVDISREGSRTFATSKDGFRFLLAPGEYPSDGMIMIRSGDIKLSQNSSGSNTNSVKGKIMELSRAEYGYEVFIKAGHTFYATFSEDTFKKLSPETGMNIELSFSPDVIKVM